MKQNDSRLSFGTYINYYELKDSLHILLSLFTLIESRNTFSFSLVQLCFSEPNLP